LVTDVKEAVVFEEEVIEYLVAVLLVDVASLVDTSLVLGAPSEQF